MLNTTEKKVVCLDGETLRYMYFNHTGARTYPVMKKLYTLLSDGFQRDWLVVPLSVDLAMPYIKDGRLDQNFLSMMGGIGQVQFHSRFTIKTLQLIRIINHFFENPYNKPPWRDAFASDPDERYRQGFNRYSSLTAQVVQQAVSREKNYSQVFEFIEDYKKGAAGGSAARHFRSIWEQFADLIRPNLPTVGSAESHIAKFLQNDEINFIPEFHIMSILFNPLVEAYGIENVEHGLRDEELRAAESVASFLPYCHYYVTKVDIAEILMMSDISETYAVRVYDHNESSLYRLMQDITDDYQGAVRRNEYQSKRTIFQKGGTHI